MFCPKCGGEYVEGATQCWNCDVALVDSPPSTDTPPAPEPPRDLETVFRCSHPGLVAVAKSILTSADIPFVVINEATQDLIGLGRFPAGFNIALGPVEIMVPRSDIEDAAALLADLQADASADAVGETGDEKHS